MCVKEWTVCRNVRAWRGEGGKECRTFTVLHLSPGWVCCLAHTDLFKELAAGVEGAHVGILADRAHPLGALVVQAALTQPHHLHTQHQQQQVYCQPSSGCGLKPRAVSDVTVAHVGFALLRSLDAAATS